MLTYDERGKKVLQILEASFDLFSSSQKYKNVARALLTFRQNMKGSRSWPGHTFRLIFQATSAAF